MTGVTHLNPNLWWYFARAGGLVSWALLAASVFWGLIYAGRMTRKIPRPAWNLDIHRFLGGLSVIFVAVHVTALMADRYVDFGLAKVLVPFASRWRPGAVAWGITAFYLLVAVEATSLAMRWLPRKLWRPIHLMSFALFTFSTVHAVQTGTDTANPLVRAIGIGLVATATITAILRVMQAQRRTVARRRALPLIDPSPIVTRPVASVASPADSSEDVPPWTEPISPPLHPYLRPPKVHRFAEPASSHAQERVGAASADRRAPR